MPSFLGPLIFIVIWFFIITRAGKAFKNSAKKRQEEQNNSSEQENETTSTASTEETQTGYKTFRDIFSEIKKQADEAKAKQYMPPYAQPETKKIEPVKTVQDVIREREVISKKEKADALEYDQFVKKQQEKNIGTINAAPTQVVLTLEAEYEPFEIDLRNAMVGSVILDPPYL